MMAYEWRHAFTRIQIEYIEMPDLKLTLAQIRRLCDLPEELCQPAVAALEQVGFCGVRLMVDLCAARSAAPAARSATRISTPRLDSVRKGGMK